MLAPGDLLLAFTDGLTEALNESGEEFGDARAAGLLVGNRHLGARDLQRLVSAELEAFCGGAPPHDDVTIVVARVIQAVTGSGSRTVPEEPDAVTVP